MSGNGAYPKYLVFYKYICTMMINKELESMSTNNPFIVNNPIPVVALPKKGAISQTTELTEQENNQTPLEKLTSTHYLYDQQKKVNVFMNGKKEGFEMLYGKLNPKGRDMLLYIIYNMPENQDWIEISAAKVSRNTGISRNSLTTGLNALRDAAIICNKTRSVYWVNPKYIFNGNRINYYLEKDSIVVKSILGGK